jgi:hypothetical protein
MQLQRPAILASLALLALSAPVGAQITSYTDYPSWSAAAGAHTTIAFTEVPLNTLLTAEYQAQGLTFVGGNDQVIANGAFVNDNTGVNGNGRIEVSLATPKTEVGCDFPGAMTIDLYSGATLIGSSSDFAGSGTGFFGGVVSLQPFDRFVIRDWADDLVYIDDLHVGGGAGASTYCTAGTTSHGCVPAIAWSGTPSASASSGFTISASGVEGQRLGLFFYGAAGQQALSWGAGGTSFLCIKAPVQRMTPQQSGGTVNQCNGALSQDWSAFLAATPGALGHPLMAGQVFDAQGWFRDPPAVKTTNLTDGLHFVLAP